MIFDCIKKNTISGNREVVILMCSGLVRGHVEHHVEFQVLRFSKDIDKPEILQRKAAK